MSTATPSTELLDSMDAYHRRPRPRRPGAIDRVPRLGDRGEYLRQLMQDKLVEHDRYINLHGLDLPEILNWTWEAPR